MRVFAFTNLLPVALLLAALPSSYAQTYTVGTTLPATCNVGDLFFLTTATIGHNLHGCAQTNGWALEGIGTGIITQPTNNNTTASITWNTPPANGVTVSAKQSVAITSDRPATWTLQPGSRGSISVSGNTVTYTAPASVVSPNAVAGCELLPADTVYTTPITALPVSSGSAGWIAQSLGISPVGLSMGEAWGHNIVDNSTPLTKMTFYYSTGLNGVMYPLLKGNNRNRETGSMTTDGGNDHHMVTINRQNCHTYETYHDYLTGLENAPAYTANSGYDYTSATYTMPLYGSTDAAGLPIMPLTVHYSEWEAGAINHALRFTSCAGCISQTVLWPATGSTAYAPNAAPMGSRWRLKPTFNISTFSPKAQVVLKALQNYGMLLADIGGMQQVQFDDDINQDPALSAALGEIQGAHIIQSDFDIVDESSLMLSSSSSRVNPTNGYTTPPNFAQLNGVDAAGNTLNIPISVHPVLVGVPHEYLLIQAGTSYQMSAWVNNSSSNQTVAWSTTTGGGTITSSGLYTAPTGVTTPIPFLVTAKSTADSTATATIRGYIIPSGNIRIDVAGPGPYTDSQGNVWLADNLGVYSGSYNNDNETYPGSKWNNATDWFLNGWFKYTWGDDIVYGPFVVPNGTYQVNFQFDEANCSGPYDPNRQFDGILQTGGTLGLEANGVMTPFNFGQAVNYTCLVPATGSIKTSVTNGLLTVALRATGSDAGHQAPFLNALSIIKQ